MSFLLRPRHSDHSGFSLVELLVAAAIASVLMLGTASMINYMQQGVQGVRTASSRDQLLIQLSRLAGNKQALTNSINNVASGGFPANSTISTGMLAKCVNGTGTCTALSGGTPVSYDMTLVDTASNPVAGPYGSGAVYDANGAFCGNETTVTASPKCPIVATASFTAACPNNTATCTQAQNITVSYTLKQRTGVILTGLGMINAIKQSVTSSVPLSAGGGYTGQLWSCTCANQLGYIGQALKTTNETGLGCFTGNSYYGGAGTWVWTCTQIQ